MIDMRCIETRHVIKAQKSYTIQDEWIYESYQFAISHPSQLKQYIYSFLWVWGATISSHSKLDEFHGGPF